MPARIIAIAGAMCSLGLMLYAGRNQRSVILIVLFTGWVLSPFVGLLVADAFSHGWSIATRNAVSALMVLVAIASVAAYGYDAFRPGRTKAAAIFLIVPFISWFTMVVVVSAVALRSGSKKS
jgi:hypothetical protein